ncbi:MAG: hypothetical protein HGA45_08260 [Chloroflexales bacterium]|nr:hypothetical protein [Chloroflexales bacterium]
MPELHGKPDGKRIRIAVAVVKSTSATPAPDPLVYLEGGPGGSALKNVTNLLSGPFGQLLSNRDLIIYDQRGAGYSEPALTCPEAATVGFDALEQNLSAADFITRRNAALVACHDRLVQAGVNLAAYNSLESAADLEELRRSRAGRGGRHDLCGDAEQLAA